MIYSNFEYRVVFYKEERSGRLPVREYINNLSLKDRSKVLKYIAFLQEHKGVLDEPYSKHIRGKIRELRVNLARNKHRILYFVFIEKTIILLHAFLKRTEKTPEKEIKIAENNYHEVIKNKEVYK